jgi:hypothetical protein
MSYSHGGVELAFYIYDESVVTSELECLLNEHEEVAHLDLLATTFLKAIAREKPASLTNVSITKLPFLEVFEGRIPFGILKGAAIDRLLTADTSLVTAESMYLKVLLEKAAATVPSHRLSTDFGLVICSELLAPRLLLLEILANQQPWTEGISIHKYIEQHDRELRQITQDLRHFFLGQETLPPSPLTLPERVRPLTVYDEAEDGLQEAVGIYYPPQLAKDGLLFAGRMRSVLSGIVKERRKDRAYRIKPRTLLASEISSTLK